MATHYQGARKHCGVGHAICLTRASGPAAPDVTNTWIADIVLQLLSYVAQVERENPSAPGGGNCSGAGARGPFRSTSQAMPPQFELVRDSYKGRRYYPQPSSKVPGRVRGDVRSLDARGGVGGLRRFVASCCDSNFDTVTMSFFTLADIQKGGWPLGARKTNNRMDRDRSLFAVTLAGIWVLTEQNAVETSLLSESTARGRGSGYRRSGCRCHG